jgi:UDP-2-acetamido-3-amino-2,3-dideoxy-glucuronate N-acetyltransferase
MDSRTGTYMKHTATITDLHSPTVRDQTIAERPPRVHPTALIEEGVRLGPGSAVWDGVHVRRGATVGRCCIIGEKTYVAYDVCIGDFVKLNAAVYVCAGVTIEDFVMVSAHTVFTNDRFPRAGNRELSGLETSDVTDETLHTHVHRGATIGANATIGPGVTLGEFCMVGMGSVVTHDVAPHVIAVGNPAVPVGFACVCGQRIFRDPFPATTRADVCARCERAYLLDDDAVCVTADPYVRV